MAGTTVKAWQYTNGYPSTLHQSTIPLPSSSEIQNSKDSYLVRIHACALNPVDIQTMNMPKWNLPFGSYRSPKGTVMDFSGTVIEPGKSGFSKGDEIFGMTLTPFAPCNGALVEVAKFDVSTTPAVLKPKGWSWEKAAGISLVWLTAKACIENVAKFVDAPQSKKRVAVLGGSSAVGMYTIKLAKLKGWKVVATSSGRNKEFVVRDLGADGHVDYTTENVREGVGKFGPDAVIDCVGGTECIGLPTSKRYISIVGDKTGRTMMGGPYTYYDYLHPLTAAMQWVRWAKGEYGLGESYDVVILSPKKKWLEEAKTTLSAEEIYVDSVHAFEDAKKAFERLNTGRAKGKVVVDVAGGAEQGERITLGEHNIYSAQTQGWDFHSHSFRIMVRRPASQTPPLGVLGKFPPELRAIIYELVLKAPALIHITKNTFEQPALLQVCRQLRKEAADIYYRKYKFGIKVEGYGST